MALTNKSAIRLTVHDWKVHEGVYRILDRRLGERLEYAIPRFIRRLIRNNREKLETRYKASHGDSLYSKDATGRGGTETQYWLTKEQALFICAKSEAANWEDVLEEIIKTSVAALEGRPLPATPSIDALFAPDPEAQEGIVDDDGVIRGLFDEQPEPQDTPAIDANAEHLRAITGIGRSVSFDELSVADHRELIRNSVETWTDHHDGVAYPIRSIRNLRGQPMFLYVGTGYSVDLMVPNANGETQVMVRVAKTLPYSAFAVVERNYRALDPDPPGPYAPIAIATLRHWLAL